MIYASWFDDYWDEGKLQDFRKSKNTSRLIGLIALKLSNQDKLKAYFVVTNKAGVDLLLYFIIYFIVFTSFGNSIQYKIFPR